MHKLCESRLEILVRKRQEGRTKHFPWLVFTIPSSNTTCNEQIVHIIDNITNVIPFKFLNFGHLYLKFHTDLEYKVGITIFMTTIYSL